MGGFFLLFRLTIAIAWNRRAERLVRVRELKSSWLGATDEERD
jgi:hypothetical protein